MLQQADSQIKLQNLMDVLLQGIVPDSAGVEGLEAVLQDALDAGADVLITSGGRRCWPRHCLAS